MPKWSSLSRKAKARRSAGAWAAGQLASGNFTNIATNNAADGVYTINGQMVAITDIIDLNNPYSTFNPETDIDAGGIKPRDPGGGFFLENSIEIKEPLLSSLLANGFTILLECYTDTSTISVDCHDPDFNVETSASLSTSTGSGIYAQDGTFTQSGADLPTEESINKFSATITDTHMAYSLNGAATVAITAGQALGGAIDQIQLQVSSISGNGRLRAFTFYEVVDDTDLPTLSALS